MQANTGTCQGAENGGQEHMAPDNAPTSTQNNLLQEAGSPRQDQKGPDPMAPPNMLSRDREHMAPVNATAPSRSEAVPVPMEHMVPAAAMHCAQTRSDDAAIELLEIFAGEVRIPAACRGIGLRVGTPIDLHTGYDLNESHNQLRVWKIIKEQKPAVVFLAPPCTVWSTMSNVVPPASPRRTTPCCHGISTFLRAGCSVSVEETAILRH